ncbi:MAG: site-2 protease family protein [Halolamina sp.]
MNDLLWVLVGLLAFSTVAVGAKARGFLPESVRVQGPILSIHTERGKELIDRIATARRFWQVWTGGGLVVTAAVMVGAAVALPVSALSALQRETTTQVTEPQNVLVIPGVNDFLPLSVAPEILFGLLIGLVVHEGGHGILCRVGDIDIDSMGIVLLSVLPIAAFVQPDEESRDDADRGSQALMFAGGVTNNFALTGVCLLLLFGPVTGAIAVADGVGVGSTVPGSPAAAAGIDGGDRITAVGDTPVDDESELDAALSDADGDVSVTTADGERVTVDRYVYLTRTSTAVREALGVSADRTEPPRVTAVAGQSVGTESEFRSVLREETVATVETTAGSVELVAGAVVTAAPDDGAFARATAVDPANRRVVITRLAGERVLDVEDLTDVLGGLDAGETTTVEYYVDGEARTTEVTLGSDDDDARLGVRLRSGVGGVAVGDFGAQTYPAAGFLSLLGGEAGGGGLGGVLTTILLVLTLPLISTIQPTPFNFAGFTGANSAFYTVPGLPDAPVFILANVLFWTAWVNLNLATFNCIPSFPLDGGHILRVGAEVVVDRLPLAVDRERDAVLAVTGTMGLLMVGSFLLLFVGPQVGNVLGL